MKKNVINSHECTLNVIHLIVSNFFFFFLYGLKYLNFHSAQKNISKTVKFNSIQFIRLTKIKTRANTIFGKLIRSLQTIII